MRQTQVIAILAGLVLGMSIVSTASALAQAKIQIGCTATSDCASAMVAVDEGIFKKHGLDVEVVLTEMPSPSLVQLQANIATANEQLGRVLGAAYRPAEVVPFTWGKQPEGLAAKRATPPLPFLAGFSSRAKEAKAL